MNDFIHFITPYNANASSLQSRLFRIDMYLESEE
jgi:hypothetical protein